MSLEQLAVPPPGRRRTKGLGISPRVLLATLSAGAGTIHLAMVPSHAGESIIEGGGFLVAGWLQLALAAVLLVRPSKRALETTVVVNLVFIGLWAMSRTTGLPVGARPWHPETVSFVDVTCVAIEAALVFVAHGLTLRPGIGRDWTRGRLALSVVLPLAIVVLTVVTVMSPSARDHAAHSHDDAGHDHAAVAGDRGLSLLIGAHPHNRQVTLDPVTRATLSAQLSLTRRFMDAFPTIAAAEAAGYTRSGPFAPGLGTHYDNFNWSGANPDGIMDVDDIIKPTLVYDGLAPTSLLAGFMYLATSSRTPAGFVGPNDHWHAHTNTCVLVHNGLLEAPLGADGKTTTKQCRAHGGTFYEKTAYMVHVWTVPGYESALGVFSSVNPAITCPDGTYYMKDLRTIGFSPNACLNS